MTEFTLSAELIERLRAYGVETNDEVELRQVLEEQVSAYTLYRLPPAAARKWKARYRIMISATYLDCQTVSEAYARAYLFTRESVVRTTDAPDPQNA
jgi:hypothetical protein